MKLGAEPKKVAILGGLALVAGYLLFFSGESDVPASTAPRPAPRTAAAPSPAAREASPVVPRGAAAARRGGREFRPSLKPRRPEDRPDPMTIDPTLRLDVLAKLQEARLEGVTRSLFEFSKAPPPKAPEPKLSPETLQEIQRKREEEAAKTPPGSPPKPPPPPITIKFYGYVNRLDVNDRRAFFLDGEDIFVAGEGEVVKKRYRIVKIGVNSAVVEDTEHDHQQTLKLEEARG